MTQEEILSKLFKLRGTTLCLGVSIDAGMGMFGISGIVIDKTTERLVCIPSDSLIKDDKLCIYINGKKWDVRFFPNRHISNKIIACVSTETFLNDIRDGNAGNAGSPDNKNDTFLKYVQTLCATNILMIDTFPFHTKELVNSINRIRELSEWAHVEFGMALLSGVRKYGSTDISTEADAVKKEKAQLQKEGISCVEVERTVAPSQILDLLAPSSCQFVLASERFKADCQTTDENLEMYRDFMGGVLMVNVNMSLKEYIAHVKNTMNMMIPMFPAVKYLSDSFYHDFENAIRPSFISGKEAENMVMSKKFANSLYYALKSWMEHKCKYKQI